MYNAGNKQECHYIHGSLITVRTPDEGNSTRGGKIDSIRSTTGRKEKDSNTEHLSDYHSWSFWNSGLVPSHIDRSTTMEEESCVSRHAFCVYNYLLQLREEFPQVCGLWCTVMICMPINFLPCKQDALEVYGSQPRPEDNQSPWSLYRRSADWETWYFWCLLTYTSTTLDHGRGRLCRQNWFLHVLVDRDLQCHDAGQSIFLTLQLEYTR